MKIMVASRTANSTRINIVYTSPFVLLLGLFGVTAVSKSSIIFQVYVLCRSVE